MKLPLEQYREIVATMPILCVDGIIVHQGQYLLVKRKNEPLKWSYWLPGGRVFRGEGLERAFLRKMEEELGIEVKITSLAGFHEYIYKENEFGLDFVHTLSAVFIASPLTTNIKLDSQSEDYMWSDNLPKELNLYAKSY